MDKILFNAMLSRIQKEIMQNKDEIESVNKIDIKYCKIQVSLKKIVNIIENYKNRDINYDGKELLVYCNGNPYIVLNLIMIAICTRISIKINIDDNMLGVNTCILKIINNILYENELGMNIEFVNEISADHIVFIDRVNDYNILKEQYKYAKFIPYESLDIYCEAEEYEELFEKVYDYAIDMNIDIDVFDKEEGIDSIYKFGKSAKVLILTNDKEAVRKVNNKRIYVNENPFKEEDFVFSEEMIELVIG